jgi:hypothetical protein
MSDDKEATARRVLGALAEASSAFREAAIEIGRLKNVDETLSAFEAIKYETEATLEGYLDAELKGGNGISWLLDVTWTESEWSIRGKMVKSTSAGQETFHELAGETLNTFDEFVEYLPRIIQQLLRLRAPELTE